MVDSIRHTPRSIPLKNTTERVQESNNVETHTDEKSGEAYIVTRDRRGKKDRRQTRRDQRVVYDMRSGKGRRKDDPGQPNIEIKV